MIKTANEREWPDCQKIFAHVQHRNNSADKGTHKTTIRFLTKKRITRLSETLLLHPVVKKENPSNSTGLTHTIYRLIITIKPVEFDGFNTTN